MTAPWYARWWPSYAERCETFRLRVQVHLLQMEKAELERQLDRAQFAVRATIHDNLLLRSEPCNLRRNDQ